VAAGPPRRGTPRHAASRPTKAPSIGKNLPPIAIAVARLFFPQSKSLGIDLDSTSPALLKKIVYAGSNNPSFQRASEDLRILAGVRVNGKQVERLTQRMGQERQQERDAATAAWLARPLAQREEPPPGGAAPQLAVVERDGGRLQIRRPGDEPDNSDPAAPPEATLAQGQPQATVPEPARDPSTEAPPASRKASPAGRPKPSTGVRTRWAACSG
jgi:hypothetical protein